MSKTPRAPKGWLAAKKGARSENRLVTAVVLTALITTLVSASAVIFFQKFVESGPTTNIETKVAPAPATPKYDRFVYYDFPKLTVFLKKTDNGQQAAALATIRVSAEFTDAAPLQSTKMAQPRIVDAMQTYLRDCSREDLDGRKGTDMLRQAFLEIVNNAITPQQANAVLFREIVIQ